MAEMKHSGFGIASFAIYVLAVIILCGSLLAAIIVFARLPARESTNILAGGLAVVGGLFMLLASLIGTGLGLAGLFQPERRRAFPIAGLVVNGATLLGMVFLTAFSVLLAIAAQLAQR